MNLARPPNGVVAVVVTYFPELVKLNALLESLLQQVDKVVMVDNGSERNLNAWVKNGEIKNLFAIMLGNNYGLAKAQNVGITQARELGAKFILLSDQDSFPSKDMVLKLLMAVKQKQLEGNLVAAVGPKYSDAMQGGLKPFVRVSWLRVHRLDCNHSGQIIQVNHLIASGSLVPVSSLDVIGGMLEPLFIDYVDTEWCLRAWRKGYRLYGVCNATMRHALGDEPNYFFGRYVPVHKPIRHYYMFRNAVWLYQQGWIPFNWKFATGLRLFMKFLYFSIIHPGRLAQTIMIIRGVWDGMVKRMGKYEL